MTALGDGRVLVLRHLTAEMRRPGVPSYTKTPRLTRVRASVMDPAPWHRLWVKERLGVREEEHLTAWRLCDDRSAQLVACSRICGNADPC